MPYIISNSIVQSGINYGFYGSLVLSLLLMADPAATSFVYSDRAHSQADPVWPRGTPALFGLLGGDATWWGVTPGGGEAAAAAAFCRAPNPWPWPCWGPTQTLASSTRFDSQTDKYARLQVCRYTVVLNSDMKESIWICSHTIVQICDVWKNVWQNAFLSIPSLKYSLGFLDPRQAPQKNGRI